MGQLTSMHFYGWKKGLKTGMYYLRTRPAAQAIQFTVEPVTAKVTVKTPNEASTPVRASAKPAIVTEADVVEDPALPTKNVDTLQLVKAEDPVNESKVSTDPDFEAAKLRALERQLAEAKLMCSLENKEACLMCSG